MSHRVSVVLPVYNAEDTLDRAVESILQQTEEDFQFVIVDDGSADSSAKHIKKWAERDGRIFPIFNEHQGIVPALKAGIQKTDGRYIARMDADDISLPSRLKRQADFLDQHPDIGVISCQVEHLGDQDKQKGYARYVDWLNELTSQAKISINRFIESPLVHPSVMFRTHLVDKHGGYRNGRFPEDYELWLRWLQQEVRMAKIPDVLLKWRDQPDRLSRTHKRYSVEAFYKTKAKYLAHWLAEHNPHQPDVLIWGAGSSSRKRAELLTQHGIRIAQYIDVDPNKIGQKIHGRTVLSYQEIPQKDKCFIISFVGNRGVNEEIAAHLNNRGYILGKHFIFAA